MVLQSFDFTFANPRVFRALNILQTVGTGAGACLSRVHRAQSSGAAGPAAGCCEDLAVCINQDLLPPWPGMAASTFPTSLLK